MENVIKSLIHMMVILCSTTPNTIERNNTYEVFGMMTKMFVQRKTLKYETFRI